MAKKMRRSSNDEALRVSGHKDSRNGPGRGTGTPRAAQAEVSADIAISAVRRDLLLSLITRICLLLLGLATGILAIVYTWQRSNEIAGGGGPGVVDEQLVALILPTVLFGVLAGAAGFAAWSVHSRGLDETYRALDTASRISRESEVAVSARGLVRSFEEKLDSARRAFSLLLWFGRTMFIVSLGLFAFAVINAIFKGDNTTTLVLGAGSIVGTVVSVFTNVPDKVKGHLADVVAIQTILTGCDRQISLLESYAFATDDEHGVDEHRVLEAQERIDDAVEQAARRIARVQGKHVERVYSELTAPDDAEPSPTARNQKGLVRRRLSGDGK